MVHQIEEEVIINNYKENRSKLHYVDAQYIKYLKFEASILRKKSQLHWFKEGETKSNYHAILRGRIRKLLIQKILVDNEN